MTKFLSNLLTTPLTGIFLLGATLSQGIEVQANPLESSESLSEATLISLQFEAPNDPLPSYTVPGGSRGNIQFAPPGDAIPRSTASGGSRGATFFQAPGDAIPRSTVSGGSRGETFFQAPGDAIPRSTVSGGSRGEALFQAPGDAIPRSTVSGGSRGEALFQAPGDAIPRSTVAGGSRNDSYPEALAVLPDKNYGRTITARPTFFVYVPPTASQEVFFSIQDENRVHHYQTTLNFSGEGGIVSITLPEDAPALEVGKGYRWFVALIEPGEVLRPDNYDVNGWIRRVAPPISETESSAMTTIERASLYAKSGIWYDTLEILSSAILAQPNNATLADEWKDLLEQVKLEEISTQPIREQL